MQEQIAKASVVVDAPKSEVWEALVDPDTIRKYMFGTNVSSDWKEGGTIVWRGEWQGKRYEDKGIILELEPEHKLRYSHYSPLSGLPDRPESYHTVTIELSDDRDSTRVTLEQDNNPDEQSRAHSEANWRKMLEGLKEVVEQA
jgi:uncharacterized protein YndB with AHSA1/START domain